jgi:polar amino acid transport system substrate-binding protein
VNTAPVVSGFSRTVIALALAGACAPPAGYRDDVGKARAELTPTGTLRAAINSGNPVLVARDPSGGQPRGIAAELTRELAAQLGVPFTLVTYDSAPAVADDASADKWDVAFIGADPARADIAFTEPYLVLEPTYLVPAGSSLMTAGDVDAEGVRVAARPRTAYDLALRRTLRRARLVYPAEGETDVELLRSGRADALAGLRQVLEETSTSVPGSRVLDGSFATIGQALGVPRGRAEAAAYLQGFVEDAKRSGLVARAIEASGARGASVAP